MLRPVKTASFQERAGFREPAAPAADTSDKLIAAAERLFADHGYTNVSVRAIAAAAGVNWSLVGYYFPGRKAYSRKCIGGIVAA